jgi:hypothetical protein
MAGTESGKPPKLTCHAGNSPAMLGGLLRHLNSTQRFSNGMIKWLKSKLHQKKVADRMRRHMAAASGTDLHKGVIAVAMTALDDDLFQEELSRMRAEQRNTFMMAYECVVLWAILRGCALTGISELVRIEIVSAVKSHLAQHAPWYATIEFGKLWDETQKWMPELAKPSKNGNLWPATALVQIPHAAGARLDYIPSMAFGYHVINTLESVADIGKFAAQQELQRKTPNPGNLLEASIGATSSIVVRFFRELGTLNNCPPTAKTSDPEIIEIYSLVGTAFQEAAKKRGEGRPIPAALINRIVSGFLQIYEKKGATFLREHLQYEIDNYVREGLRPDYQHPLPFFPRDDENSDSAAWLEKARALAEAGRPDQAIAWFDNALAADPQSAKSWFGKGEVLFHQGRIEEAHECFDKALKLDPQCVTEWIRRVMQAKK